MSHRYYKQCPTQYPYRQPNTGHLDSSAGLHFSLLDMCVLSADMPQQRKPAEVVFMNIQFTESMCCPAIQM